MEVELDCVWFEHGEPVIWDAMLDDAIASNGEEFWFECPECGLEVCYTL